MVFFFSFYVPPAMDFFTYIGALHRLQRSRSDHPGAAACGGAAAGGTSPAGGGLWTVVKHGFVARKSQGKMGKIWENDGKIWGNDGKIWENDGNNMGKYGNIGRKYRKNRGKT